MNEIRNSFNISIYKVTKRSFAISEAICIFCSIIGGPAPESIFPMIPQQNFRKKCTPNLHTYR